MKSQDLEMCDALVKELRDRHGCHTVILYGSRARGDFTESSDYDILAIRAEGPRDRDVRELGEARLDAFIYPEADLRELEPGMIRLCQGIVLLEHQGQGAQLVERATELFRRGPAPLSSGERSALRAWVIKMLARVARGGPEDLEANYRRAWLLYELPELYFKLRGRWFLGSKEAFAWLRKNDPRAYAAFEQALSPEASRGALRKLAELVLDA